MWRRTTGQMLGKTSEDFGDLCTEWDLQEKRLGKEALRSTQMKLVLKSDWRESNPVTFTLLPMIRGHAWTTAGLHTWLSARQPLPTDDAPAGQGSLPTHFTTEAVWVRHETPWCGQGPAWVSQSCRTNTCLDFYHKSPKASVNEPTDCCAAFSLGAWDLNVRQWGKTWCLLMRSKANI